MVVVRVTSKEMTASVEEMRKRAINHVKKKSDPPESAFKCLMVSAPGTPARMDTTLRTFYEDNDNTPNPEPEVYAHEPI